MIRVGIAVRSSAARAAIERAIRPLPAVTVVPLATSPVTARADVLFVDHMDGVRDRGRRRERGPAVILLSDDLNPGVVARALGGGAHGVLPARATAAELTAAVEAVAVGLVVVPADRSPAVSETEPVGGRLGLTERELEVLRLLATGLPNRAIGARLGISGQTVKTYVASILHKTGAATRTEAVAIGVRRGLITV